MAKILTNNSAGAIVESVTVQTSAGAPSADKIPSLNSSGVLDATIVNSKASSSGAGDAGKIAALDVAGKISSTMLPVGSAAADSVDITTTEVIAAGAIVNLHSSSGTKVRNADASNNREAHGFTQSGAGSGATCTVLLDGVNSAVSGRTPGATQYLSPTTPGAVTETAPSVVGQIVQRVGVALSSTAVRVQPRRTIMLTTSNVNADSVWQPLTVMSLVNPMDFGAAGNGSTNDLAALQAAVTALPAAGGVVYFPPGNTFRKNGFWDITKDHVKLWRPCAGYQPGREATVNAFNADAGATQSIRWLNRVGAGAFGVKFVSDATARTFSFEDMGLAYLNSTDIETVGCEIVNSAAASVVISTATRAYQEHNYIHDSFADGFFHAYDTTSLSYNWSNFGVNVGDDFVSVVTNFGSTMPHDIETWLNTIVGGGARGYSVIGGGPNINIHDNWAISTGAAGIIFASESSFNTETVNGVAYSGNKVKDCCTIITSHSGILVSGLNPSAAALSNIAGTGNWSVNSGAQPYRTEGSIGAAVTSTGLQTTLGSLPTPIPVAGDAAHGDTTVMRTRDVSHVAVGSRPGLYRIHVRKTPAASTFQQRFEYVVKGTIANVNAFCNARSVAGDSVSFMKTVSTTRYAVVLCAAPVDTAAASVSPVTFAELRTGDNDGTLSDMWSLIDLGAYP